MSTAECCLTGSGERKIPIEFTNLGCMRMEQASGLKLPSILITMGQIADAANRKTAIQRAKAAAEAQSGIGITEMLCLLFAGLEGHRAKAGARPDAYTLQEASDIMDECGGMAKISQPVMEAFALYMPKLTGEPLPDAKKKPPKRKAAKASQPSSTS